MSEPLPEAFSTILATVKPERASPELPAESSTPAPSIPLADSSSTQQQTEDALPPAPSVPEDVYDNWTSATSPSPDVNEREGSAYEDEGDMALDQNDEYEGDASFSSESGKRPSKTKRRDRARWTAEEDEALWRGAV
ncbi:Transketolase [Rhodotorula toruloides]